MIASTIIAHAQTIRVNPVGDGGSLGVVIDNPNVSSATFRLGPPSGGGLDVVVERVEQIQLTVQCLNDARSTLPELELSGTNQPRKVEPFSIAFPDGAPIVWLTTARKGRAALQELIRQYAPESRVVLGRPSEVPTHFSALRFSPLIVVNLVDWIRLNPRQQTAVLDAVGAGTHLLVTAGEGGQLDETLGKIVEADIQVGKAAEPDITRHLPRASARRIIVPRGNAKNRLLASAGTLMTSTQYGLGEIRVLGINLRELDPSLVSRAAFELPSEPLAPILTWLDASQQLDLAKPAVLGTHVLLLLACFFLGLAVFRRYRGLALSFVLLWCCSALFFPPTFAATDVAASRVVGISAGARTLVVGTVRLGQATAGLRTVNAGSTPVSLEMTRGGSVCLLSSPSESRWLFSGDPGTSRQLVYVQWRNETAEGAERVFDFPKTADLPWRHATIRRSAQTFTLPFDVPSENAEFFTVMPQHSKGSEPPHLARIAPDDK